MNKKMVLVIMVICLLLLFASISLGAANLQQASRDNQAMRQNVAWLTEGLLNMVKNPKLALTKEQKNKILPLFKALIDKRIVQLTNDQPNRNQRNNQNQGNQGNFQSQFGGGQRNINDPRILARGKRMQEETAFGNVQVDLIDKVLTKEQLSFIDNMDFNAEKYGFIDFGKLFGGNGQRQGQRPDQNTMNQMRTKIQAGRERLVKLNNDVVKMLNI